MLSHFIRGLSYSFLTRINHRLYNYWGESTMRLNAVSSHAYSSLKTNVTSRSSRLLDVHSSRDIVVCRLLAALSVSEPWENPRRITNVGSARKAPRDVSQTSTLNFHSNHRTLPAFRKQNGKSSPALMRTIRWQKSRSRERRLAVVMTLEFLTKNEKREKKIKMENARLKPNLNNNGI